MQNICEDGYQGNHDPVVAKTMSFDAWCAKYKPIKNHLAKGEDRDYFETYDLELGYVLGIADTQPNRVWTYVDGDDGTYVIDGYHLVNRIYYFITEKPYRGSGLEVCVNKYEDDEPDLTDHYLAEQERPMFYGD